jgi:hypothetical protein
MEVAIPIGQRRYLVACGGGLVTRTDRCSGIPASESGKGEGGETQWAEEEAGGCEPRRWVTASLVGGPLLAPAASDREPRDGGLGSTWTTSLHLHFSILSCERA